MKDDDFVDRKNDRRKNIKQKSVKKIFVDENDDKIIHKKIKNQIKQQKQEIDNEEWEDWDRYYNH
jgi:hypothetical protein